MQKFQLLCIAKEPYVILCTLLMRSILLFIVNVCEMLRSSKQLCTLLLAVFLNLHTATEHMSRKHSHYHLKNMFNKNHAIDFTDRKAGWHLSVLGLKWLSAYRPSFSGLLFSAWLEVKRHGRFSIFFHNWSLKQVLHRFPVVTNNTVVKIAHHVHGTCKLLLLY